MQTALKIKVFTARLKLRITHSLAKPPSFMGYLGLEICNTFPIGLQAQWSTEGDTARKSLMLISYHMYMPY